MSGLVTFVVTDSTELQSAVDACLNSSLHETIKLPSVGELLQFLNTSDAKPSTILLEIPQDTAEFEINVRKLKRMDSVQYVPCVGLVRAGQFPTLMARQLFFHILEMPLQSQMLSHTLESAENDFKRYRSLLNEVKTKTSAISLIDSGTFHLQTLKEAEALTAMLSLAYPEPPLVAVGLSELLINAIEHGNLQVSYEEKTRLLETGKWENEIAQRLAKDEYKDKFVEVEFQRNKDNISLVIRDQGDGFDWRAFIDRQPDDLTALHGRGISVAISMGFSQIAYNDIGNQVTARIDL